MSQRDRQIINNNNNNLLNFHLGKTESTNFLLHHLTALSQKGTHGSGVEQTILSAGPVLEVCKPTFIFIICVIHILCKMHALTYQK